MRSVWVVVAAIVIEITSAEIAAAQDRFPPGHGWTVLGACALIDSGTCPSMSLTPGARPLGIWLVGSRPYGIPGVTYLETAGSVEAGTALFAAWRRELEGDGMRHTDMCLAVILPAVGAESGKELTRERRVWLTAGMGMERLGGTGFRPLWTGLYRIGVLVQSGSGWSMGFLHRAGMGGTGSPVRQMQVLALGHQGTHLSVNIGGLRMPSRYIEPSLAISYRNGIFRFDMGGWGSPLSPAAGFRVNIAGFEWRVECRWVPGLGTYTLWSVSGPRRAER